MTTPSPRRLKWELFALSFTALFLELIVIRWVPSVVRLVAYYANLMLLSSFLGLGLGALAVRQRWRLFPWFPVLLAADVVVLLVCRYADVGFSSSEVRFYHGSDRTLLNAALLLLVFAANALLFVPLGQRMGELFNALPRLSAYAWDLLGSLCGTVCFGLFSLLLFSPVLGFAIAMVVFLFLSSFRRWRWVVPGFGLTLALVWGSGDRGAIWSPYYHITVDRLEPHEPNVIAPPPDLLGMRDPPPYLVKVNQFGYHINAALDPARYESGTSLATFITRLADQYKLPYDLQPTRANVLVLGSGGGADVQLALASGARHVDAVEIDPVVIQVSRRFNAGAPYANPRVTVHIDDARAFVSAAPPETYDLVVFGYLDSQALFSSMSNVRLDGYIYTVESLRTAFGLLKERGLLSLSFNAGESTGWMTRKLYWMLVEATHRNPAVYVSRIGGVVMAVTRDGHVPPKPANPLYQPVLVTDSTPVELPTDDWPFLYLQKRTVPADYLVAISGMLLTSILAAGWLGGRAVVRGNLSFAFLGMGFLLLETKSIGDCTLFFGATWLVTLIVVAGVLLMVLAANLVAERVRTSSLWLYLPLFAALALLLVVPRGEILGLAYGLRLLWALLVVPLPIFFAGLIFSASFRQSPNPAAAFGANLIGAMCGGFCEYLGMAIGSQWLAAIVVVAYAASLLALRAEDRATASGVPS